MKEPNVSVPQSAPGRSRKTSRVVVPHQANRLQRGGARLVFIIERLLTVSLRWRWQDHSGCFDSPTDGPVIFCVWHNCLGISMAIFRKYPQHPDRPRRLAALVSASKDGALLARILENFGVQPIRGSSSRRGPQALLELTKWAEQGYDLAITPDGPRGPRGVVQGGVVALAQLTGRPIIPVVCRIGWKLQLRSWDRFQIPLPFSHCEVIYNQPVRVPREASESERESIRARVEEVMRDASGISGTSEPRE